MAADIAMNDMDIDFDMDGEDPEITRLRAEADAINAKAEAADREAASTQAMNTEAMAGLEEAVEEGEVQPTSIAPEKVHVRGLDNLAHDDILRWAEEHFPTDLFKRIEWIDDTSANLVYDTDVAAADALMAFSAEEEMEPLQPRAAKSLSTHPNQRLELRQAVVADVKVRGAKDRSRFYLMRPDWDPDNPDNIRPDNKRRWMEDDRTSRKYRRRDYGDSRRHNRRDSRSAIPFHEDMYGDDEQAGKDSRRTSHSSNSEYGRRQIRYSEDLVSNNDRGRLRDRSASPERNEDGRYGFDEVQPRRRTARPRSATPPEVRKSRENRGARDSYRKELFPNKQNSGALSNGRSQSNGGGSRDLFANRPSSSTNSPRELFPDKFNGTALHRRQSAKDLSPNEVADAIGRYKIDDAKDARAYRMSGRRPENAERRGNGGGGRDLFSRITGGPKVDGVTNGQEEDRGFSIKGASNDTGFSILGASERPQNPLVKELFPMKVASGNEGKDLFDGRIKGRGAQRRRAEDLF